MFLYNLIFMMKTYQNIMKNKMKLFHKNKNVMKFGVLYQKLEIS